MRLLDVRVELPVLEDEPAWRTFVLLGAHVDLLDVAHHVAFLARESLPLIEVPPVSAALQAEKAILTLLHVLCHQQVELASLLYGLVLVHSLDVDVERAALRGRKAADVADAVKDLVVNGFDVVLQVRVLVRLVVAALAVADEVPLVAVVAD